MQVVLTVHAQERMFSRKITLKVIKSVLMFGKWTRQSKDRFRVTVGALEFLENYHRITPGANLAVVGVALKEGKAVVTTVFRRKERAKPKNLGWSIPSFKVTKEGI